MTDYNARLLKMVKNFVIDLAKNELIKDYRKYLNYIFAVCR